MTDVPDDAAARADLLASIAPEDAPAHHELLRGIFRAEAAAPNDEYFENLYHCAFLLYLVADPADVPMMWRAKRRDFDTGTGFDVQFLLGMGGPETIAHLAANGHEDIAAALSRYPETSRDLTEWLEYRRGYFYPDE